MSNANERNRQSWLKKALATLPPGSRMLDAGAGELQNKKFCLHLDYVSQDFCEYKGSAGSENLGMHSENWNTDKIDIVSDILSIPEPNASFDAILCSEVLEHVPEPTRALDEFGRLLKPGGTLIITAPFASMVHMAPYHFSTGFSRFWYEYHLKRLGFALVELSPNGDWFSYLEQELRRLGPLERGQQRWSWPIAYASSLLAILYLKSPVWGRKADLACFGWHCIAKKA
jgi:ubiquinone/menaquinone biosynthesis C-methylase UbiE